MEEVIKNNDLSGLVSLLNLFSMVEEVKECFEKIPDELQLEKEIVDKEPVLKGVEIDDVYIKCIDNSLRELKKWDNLLEDLHTIYFNCKNNLSQNLYKYNH